MDAEVFLKNLGEALDSYRFGDVRSLIDQLDPSGFDAEQAAEALALLRKKRLFEELETAASTFFMAGRIEPKLRRHHAQALLDQGRLYQGLNSLRRLAKEVKDDPDEGPEVRGLIGRALKQRFVDEKDRAALGEAIDAYQIDGQAAPAENRWHGINLVACQARAARDGIPTNSTVDPEALAHGILAAVAGLRSPPVWDQATALEAAVAVGDKPTALRWLKTYAVHRDADAFELGATLRQLEQIWQIRDSDLGSAILPVLECELLRRTGGTVGFLQAAKDKTGFEAVYGNEASKSLQWLDALRERCRSIARVHEDVSGKPCGTGFLAKGSWFRDGWGDELVFVTNSHVVSERESDAAPLTPEDAVAEFTRVEGRPKASLGELIYSSPREALDISVLRIEAPEGCAPIKITAYTPTAGDGDEAARVYVAGHPAGRDLEVTLYDNQLREVENPYALYRCPTEGGNSGSPVFNGKWKAFALHHRAVDEKQLNEGVLFDSIREATKAG